MQQPIGSEPEDIRRVFLRESAVLLRPKDLELELGFQYETGRSDEVAPSGSGTIGTEIVRHRSLSTPLNVRAGLLDGLELFGALPVVFAYVERATAAGVTNDDAFNIGDLSAGLKWQAFDETLRRPACILSLGFSAPTGSDPYEALEDAAVTGSGHWSVTPSVTLIKSSDPVVVFGGVTYSHEFARRTLGQRIQPGETIGYSLGLGFAVNDDITLSGELQGAYQIETLVDGHVIEGSSAEPISMRFGMTWRLTKDEFMEPSVGIGVTEDAPDAVIGVSYFMRF